MYRAVEEEADEPGWWRRRQTRGAVEEETDALGCKQGGGRARAVGEEAKAEVEAEAEAPGWWRRRRMHRAVEE